MTEGTTMTAEREDQVWVYSKSPRRSVEWELADFERRVALAAKNLKESTHE